MSRRVSATVAIGLTVVIVLSALNVSEPIAVGLGIGVGPIVSVFAQSRQVRAISPWAVAISSGAIIGGISGAFVRWLR